MAVDDTVNVSDPSISQHNETVNVNVPQFVENVATTTTPGLTKAPKLFSSKKINVTLDDHNYLLWHQQVFLIIKTHRLLKFIDSNVQAPPKYVTQNGTVCINSEFELFEEQDGALATWLLSTVSEPVLHRLIGLSTSSDIWNTLHRLYSSKTTSSLMTYRRLFHSQKKGDLSMQDYLMKVKSICDNLANCGEIISEHEHITAILNGLPHEYDSIITVISASPTSSDLTSVCTILLDADVRQGNLMNYVNASAHITTQHVIQNPISASQHSVQNSSIALTGPPQSTEPLAYSVTQYSGSNIVQNNDGFSSLQNTQHDQSNYSSNNRGRGRGRNSNNRPQCQLCGRLGHLVDRCYFRFGVNFKNNESTRTNNRNFTSGLNAQAHASFYQGFPYNTMCYTSSHPTIPMTGFPQLSSVAVPSPLITASPPSLLQHSPTVVSSNPAATVSHTSYYPVNQTVQPVYSQAQTQPQYGALAQPQVHLTATDILDDNTWIPDSGATHHLTNDVTNLQAGSSYSSSGQSN